MKTRIMLSILVGLVIQLGGNPFVLSAQDIAGLIVYVSERQYNTDIYLLDLNDGRTTRLTSEPTSEYSPIWSPDGCDIAFVSTDIVGDISILEIGGGVTTNLTDLIQSDANFYNYPSWSPLGDSITYSSNQGDSFGLHLVDLINMRDTRLTDSTLITGRSDWSPDGEQLVFEAKHDTNSDIFTINVDGTHQQNLTDDRAYDTNPSW